MEKKNKNKSKICGLQLNGSGSEPNINDMLFDIYLKQFFNKKSLKRNVAQQRHSKDFKKLKNCNKIN